MTSESVGRVCAGDKLHLICTVVGGVNTVWTGSAILDQCSGSISLRHSAFSESITRAPQSCLSGRDAVVGQTLPASSNVSNECYTSQLSITVTSISNSTNVSCQIDNGMEQFPEIGHYMITIQSGKITIIFC